MTHTHTYMREAGKFVFTLSVQTDPADDKMYVNYTVRKT